MKRLFLITIAAALLASPLAHSDGDETRATLRAHVLQLINRDRALYNLPPVELDVDASTSGDAYCRTQIRNGTTGHYTTDGLAPYTRYSAAGGNDAVSENAAAWSATYNFNDRALYEMARRSQDAMMAETPPNDGHKRTMLDPHATHVGIGLAWEKGEFRLVQEFVRRYVDWTRPLPRDARAGQSVMLSGRAMPGVRVEGITVHHEPLPQAMSAVTASAMASYSLPEKRRDYLPRPRNDQGAMTVARRGGFPLADDGAFSFTVPFADGPGLYTVVVWVRKEGETTPFSASNVSVRVPDATTHAGGGGGATTAAQTPR
jgi:uncharacterized protein YkwD